MVEGLVGLARPGRVSSSSRSQRSAAPRGRRCAAAA